MKPSHLFLPLVGLVFFAPAAVFGQNIGKCPTVFVDGPSTKVEQGQPIVFLARLTAWNSAATPEFRWNVSAGSIVSGKDTESIVIDTAGLGGVNVTAKVYVVGLPKDCPAEASSSINVLSEIVCGLPFDRYGDIRFEDEKARLDNFAIQVTNYEASTGYIIAYAGNPSYQGEAAERLLRAKNYLVKVREMNPARIITIDGGYMEDFYVTLVIAPPGAAPPSAMPTLSRKEIAFTKPHPSLSKRKRTNK